MVIYANQSLRAAHVAISKVLKQIIGNQRLTDINEEMSSMEQIFHLQEMYTVKKEEDDIEKELKKLGYSND